MPTDRAVLAAAICVIASLAAPDAGAQAFPTKPVRYVMPLPGGSETDIFARVLAKHLSDYWNQPVVVENRPGAGTTIGSDLVAKAPPDGHTLLHAITAHGVNPTLRSRMPYDTLKDFACVTHIGNLYGILAVHPSLPVRNLKEFIALAKRAPGEVQYATGGAGTANHIAAEAIRLAAKIDIQHVPYKGSSLAVLDVLPGRVPVLATVLVEAKPYIDSNKLRVIATTSPKRAPSLPDTPTVTETLPSYRVGASFWAIVTRAGTPAPAIAKLNADARKGMASADARKRFQIADVEYVGSSPSACDAFLRDQVATWGAIVKATGASVN